MNNRRRTCFASPVFIALFIVIVPTAFGAQKTIYEYDSTYHHIRVVEEGSIRGLKFDNNYWQSKMDINDPLAGQFGYINLFFDSFLFKPDIKNVLMLGLGGGSVQKQFHYFRPDLRLLTVELDPAVLDVAEKFFYFDSVAVPVKISDARSYVNSSRDKYDLIIQDTYSSNTYGTFIPFHLATKEYFEIIKEHLTDDGVFAINVIGTVYGGEDYRVITSVYKTMRQVFPQIYLFAAEDVQNVVVIASQDENRLTMPDLAYIARELTSANPGGWPKNFVWSVNRFYDTAPGGLSQAILLTDDFAPTDNLLR